jgi:Ca-activated chloride channel family protein
MSFKMRGCRIQGGGTTDSKGGLAMRPSLSLSTILALIVASLPIINPPVRGQANYYQESAHATAEKPSQEKGAGDKVHLETRLVSLNVSVTDPFGRLVTGLRKEHFEVYDDKVKQDIAHFTDLDAPLSIGIVYDVSGSMGSTIGSSFQALRHFIETSHEEDDFFLIVFNDRSRLAEDFTTSADTLLGRLILVKPKNSTAFYDAVYLGLEKVLQGRHERKALLIISDGEDNNSRYSHKEVRERARESGVMIYGIALPGPHGYGFGVMSHVAGFTGGRSFSPGQDGMNFSDICIRIALELRHQYSIGFYPTNAKSDTKWHKVKIRVNGPRGLGRLSLTYKDRYESFGQ